MQFSTHFLYSANSCHFTQQKHEYFVRKCQSLPFASFSRHLGSTISLQKSRLTRRTAGGWNCSESSGNKISRIRRRISRRTIERARNVHGSLTRDRDSSYARENEMFTETKRNWVPGSGRTRDLTSGDVFFLYRHFSCSTEPRDCACGDYTNTNTNTTTNVYLHHHDDQYLHHYLLLVP